MEKGERNQHRDGMETRMLDAVSSLKRTIGAADHPQYQDRFVGNIMHIYVTDYESSRILHALFHQFTYGDRPVFSRNEDGTSKPMPLNERAQRGDELVWEIETYVPHQRRDAFIKRLNNYIDKLIAPTSDRSR